MAILTIAQVKTFLKITDTDADRDAQINALIPVVEEDIASYCNSRFRNPAVAFSGSFVITAPAIVYTLTCALGGISDQPFAIGDYIDLYGTARNDGYFTIATLSDTVITTTEVLVAESAATLSVYLVQWPEPVRMIAARMVGFQLDHIASAGLQSENILDYSYTLSSSGSSSGYAGGYSSDIMQGLDRYRNQRCGFGTKRQHYQDRRGNFEGGELL